MNNIFKELREGDFIEQQIAYPSLMKRHIKKHMFYLQPFFEAISNSLEVTAGKGDRIVVRIQLSKSTVEGKYNFLSFEVEDTGVGFNEINFTRIQNLFDDSKNQNNFGTGRIQYLHFFDKTDINSVYEENGKKFKRRIVLSKGFYTKHKTVIWASNPIEIDYATETTTSVSFFYPLNDDDASRYNELTSELIRDKIFLHYLSRFCLNRDNLQTLIVETYINGVLKSDETKTITSKDVPLADLDESFELKYQLYDKDRKSFIDTSKKAYFRIQSFCLSASVQKKNEVKLTSKNEIAEITSLDLSFLDKTARINNQNLLFLISSDYFTQRDNDERGVIHLKSKQDFLKRNDLFDMQEAQIFIDDIQEQVVKKIITKYPIIKKIKEEYEKTIDDLIELFALDRAVIAKIGCKYGESVESFLKRYKEYNIEIQAENEANMNTAIESLRKMNPSDKNFPKSFNKKVKEISRMIPQKQRADITNYLASRKAAMSILEYLLRRQLEVQHTTSEKKAKNKERIIHDLLFKQGSNEPYSSNLWILNEDFIHYKGVSESQLRKITINGESFLREDLTEEEVDKLHKYSRDQLGKRTDILLFPEEHKCIIIELKSTDADVSKYLTQVVDYAGLIRQYAKEKFEITNFYAYLIGESFDFDAIVNANPYFVESPYLDYVYIPDQKINGGKYRPKGTMYFEVLKYSSLLERARIRNSVFIDKLFS